MPDPNDADDDELEAAPLPQLAYVVGDEGWPAIIENLRYEASTWIRKGGANVLTIAAAVLLLIATLFGAEWVSGTGNVSAPRMASAPATTALAQPTATSATAAAQPPATSSVTPSSSPTPPPGPVLQGTLTIRNWGSQPAIGYVRPTGCTNGACWCTNKPADKSGWFAITLARGGTAQLSCTIDFSHIPGYPLPYPTTLAPGAFAGTGEMSATAGGPPIGPTLTWTNTDAFSGGTGGQ